MTGFHVSVPSRGKILCGVGDCQRRSKTERQRIMHIRTNHGRWALPVKPLPLPPTDRRQPA